ncbi:MAG: hypothetical protein K0Q90_3689 [Paenibacillaceae bacterium]|nr:hypothetical protein [Paenibacillaceae bacterium]
MKKFNLKAHNEKMAAFTKRAANGTYPSRKVAQTGSYIGSAIGIILLAAGAVGCITGSVWGWGSLFAGVATLISNMINLRRISKQSH